MTTAIQERIRIHAPRDARVVIPLTRDELERLRARARAAGAESVSAFVRAQTLRGTEGKADA